MKIHNIKKLKNNKYQILLDNEIISTFDSVILENNLLYKKEIDNVLYNKIIQDTNYYNVYNKVEKLILKKMRSEKEIRLYLLKYELSQSQIEKIINKLKNINLINDVEYCKAYINDKVYLSKRGINIIKKELIQQNIDISIIENEIEKIDYGALNIKLEKIIKKKINANKKYSNSFLKRKILNEMINLGYPKTEILQIIELNLKDDNKIIEREFYKLYNKLNKKYNSFELFNKIEQSLVLKGFNIYEVKAMIKNKTEE